MVALLLLLVLCVPAYASTFYVAKTGSDSKSCNQSQNPNNARLTINAGATCLGSGDTLIVKAGTYDELLLNVLPSGTAVNPTTLKSEVQYGAVIQPSSGKQSQLGDGMGLIFLQNRSYITIDGITVDAVNLHTVASIMSAGSGTCTHISVINTELKNNSDVGYPNSFGIIAVAQDTNWYIARNKIHHIGADSTVSPSVDARQSYGIYYVGSNGIIEDNEINNCGGEGISNYNNVSGSSGNVFRRNRLHHNGKNGLLFASGGTGNYLYNNIIDNNGTRYASPGIQVDGYGVASSNNSVWNNTIYANAGGCILLGSGGQGPTNTVVQNNICYGNSGSGDIVESAGDSGTTANHNLLGADPLFVDAAAANFYLQTASPARNTGATIATVTTDYAGVTRPQGGVYDIGAYEFVGSSLPAPSAFMFLFR